MHRIRKWFAEWRPSEVTQGAPIFPLAILFGLNAVDELDRAAFSLLLPEIRDDFGLSNTGALTLVSISTIAVLFVSIPLAFRADSGRRVRMATIGAGLWGIFSAATGAAVNVATLVMARLGAGGGRAVVAPTHLPLLSDYYPTKTRVKVFSAHQQANSVGQIVGPAVAGGLAFYFGWRLPFFVLAIPTLILVVFALRLVEPERGAQERADAIAAGRLAADAPPEAHVKLRMVETMRLLHRVRTIRRIWMAVPFLAIALFGIPNLLSLVYEDVFGLNPAARGAIAAGVEPLQIFGVFFAMPRVSKMAMKDPGFLLKFVAIVGVVDGIVLVALAYSPYLVVAIGAHAILAASIGTLAPAFFAVVSLVAPPQARSTSFTTIAVFAIPGIAIFLPLIGLVSDRLGVQASIVTMVPLTLAAGFILSSAYRFVMPDIGRAFAAQDETPMPT